MNRMQHKLDVILERHSYQLNYLPDLNLLPPKQAQ